MTTATQLERDQQTIHEWLRGCYADRLRPAQGILAHPFIDPGAGYTDVLWDWDAYFSAVGFLSLPNHDPATAATIGAAVKGCVDNFVSVARVDGSIPYAVMAQHATAAPTDAVREPDSPRNPAKPLLAQFALLASERFAAADGAWLTEIRPVLEGLIDHWYATQMTEWGVLTWRSHRGTGPDNNPAYFQRPHDSVADPYLNSMLVRECEALAYIAETTGGDSARWTQRAADLRTAINASLWDPIDQTYYCIDVGSGDPGPVRTDRNWVVPLKIRAWAMLMPLWANVAPPERAKAVIERFILDPQNLRSPHGLYSLARCEPSYQIFANYNPSDWLGPVWVVSTYLGFRALMNYGYQDEAAALAADHLSCLAADVRKHGKLHEYYHPETGEGLTHPGFVNWNSCASLFQAELETGGDHTRHWPAASV